MLAGRCVPEVLIFVGLGLVAGCAGSNDGSNAPSPVPTAPAINGPADGAPKPAELPERPEGAGEYDPDVSSELTPTGSGLYYRILRKGDGKKPTVNDKIVAHYKGWLDNGKQFDSSYGKAPLDYPLSGLVKGWQEGLPLIGEGGMIELEVPSDLGYGPKGFPPDIPPGATLHFILELKKVK